MTDATELKNNRFPAGSTHPIDDLWGQISLLNQRANSCDSEAQELSAITYRERRYALNLESSELPAQARKLQKQRIDLIAIEVSKRADGRLSGRFACSVFEPAIGERSEAQDFVQITTGSIAQ